MSNSLGGNYEVIKWTAEYTMLPLHVLALAHYYTAAIAIGALVLVIYSSATIRHLRAERQLG